MSSYTCENFQLFILYNFQFHHMVLKRLPEDLNSIFDFFDKSDFFCLLLLIIIIFSNFIINLMMQELFRKYVDAQT